MKKRIIALVLILCMALCSCSKDGGETNPVPTAKPIEPANTATATPEPTPTPVPYEGKDMIFDTWTQFQTMDGFGAAYTWYGDILLNANNSEEGLDALFSDAKLTILRFKNEYEYTMDDKAGNVLAMAKNYKAARERAAEYGETVKVLLCCWGPPASLKSDGTLKTGYGTLARHDDGTYMYEEYADWWAESVEYYRSFGIQIDYVSIQNEVDFSPESYEGCRFDPKETSTHAGYAEAFCAVYDAFREKFGDDAPVLLGPETMSCTPTSLISYSNEINKINPDALGGLAFHLYVGGTGDDKTLTVSPNSFFTNFAGQKDNLPQYKKWQTEYYIGQGIQTAELIYNALTQAEMNAYLYWSGVWHDDNPTKFESADLIEVNNSGEWRTTANYWTMRHYSEFIRPGYVRIGTESGEPKIKTVAFTNEYKNKVALVMINSSDKDIEYRVAGKDYTITDSQVFQSVFGTESKLENMYLPLGSLADTGIITLPAGSVTTIDITGYYGACAPSVPEKEPVVYTNEVLTEYPVSAIPETDVVIRSNTFDEDGETKGYSGFGSSIARRVTDINADGSGCMIVKGRADTWNGIALEAANFEHYGYLVKVSYDCMVKQDGLSVSCTSSFTVDSSTYYPDGENNRVAVFDMEAGKWYHAEGYTTMYSNMKPESFSMYWESADNTEDFYLDNIEVTIMYTMPAGEYVPEA